jgi:hypothetical protein
MKILLAGLIGFLFGFACAVAYYEWFDSDPEALITDQERPEDRSRPIQP